MYVNTYNTAIRQYCKQYLLYVAIEKLSYAVVKAQQLPAPGNAVVPRQVAAALHHLCRDLNSAASDQSWYSRRCGDD